MNKLRIGISSCLLGDEVRFDGGHKRDAFLIGTLAPFVEWIRVCPEVELGLGVPREPVRLVCAAGDTRMLGVESGIDHTDAMRAYARRRVEELAAMELCAYILKSKSPSCGLDDVKIHGGSGTTSQTGSGLFAAALSERFPDLPIEDESRLTDAATRMRFLERASAYGGLRPTRFVPVVRVDRDDVCATTDVAAAEEPLDVRLHGQSFAVIMRTPGEDRALAAGFLLSERIVRSADEIGAVEHCRHPDETRAHHVVDVFLRGGAADRVPKMLDGRRQLIASSSCGVCGRATIEELRADIAPLRADDAVDVAVIRRLPERLRARQSTFEETGGLHGAAAFTTDGTLLAAAEDVGRHNAVDKVIGSFLLEETVGSPKILMVSGRVSFEIVQKAWLAGIPVVAAISAPTSLAVELAQGAGITLLGFVRGDSLNIYTHGSRIEGV